jgi:hypothetical protein
MNSTLSDRIAEWRFEAQGNSSIGVPRTALIGQTRRFMTDDMATRSGQCVRRSHQLIPLLRRLRADYRDRMTFTTDAARIVNQDLAIAFARHGVIYQRPT